MERFLEFFDKHAYEHRLTLEIYYSKIMDWCIKIYKKGCKDGDDLVILDIQSCDLSYAFARAEMELKDWFMENNGGY